MLEPTAEQLATAWLRLPDGATQQAICAACGLTNAAVARRMDVAEVTVGRWFRGDRRPRGQTLVDYVQFLEGLADLLVEAGESDSDLPSVCLAGASL